jgi:hypothetical protein
LGGGIRRESAASKGRASDRGAVLRLGRRLGLTDADTLLLASLRTPERIQDFVNRIPWNHQPDGPSAMSVAAVLRENRAHCIEAAFVAASALWLAGQPPLLMDMGADRGDVDHVVALFRNGRHWGAISKSNSPFLRYRDPIHRSLRELCISFFSQYVKRRRKTLRTYSVPVDLRRFDPSLWVNREGFCRQMVDTLTGARHFQILPVRQAPRLRPIDEIEARSNLLRDFPDPAPATGPMPDSIPLQPDSSRPARAGGAGRSSRSRRTAVAARARAAGSAVRH